MANPSHHFGIPVGDKIDRIMQGADSIEHLSGVLLTAPDDTSVSGVVAHYVAMIEEHGYDALSSALVRLKARMFMRGEMADDAQRARYQKLQYQLFYADAAMRNAQRLLNNLNPAYDVGTEEGASLTGFTPVADVSECLPATQLHMFLYTNAADQGLRRLDGDVYARHLIESPAGSGRQVYTNAWVCTESMMEYAYRMCDANTHFEQYKMWSGSGEATRKAVVQMLQHSPGAAFPQLVIDRHVFSCRSGVFDARSCRFFRHGSLPSGLGVSANFFDLEFDERCALGTDWWSIPTPFMDRLLHFHFPVSDDNVVAGTVPRPRPEDYEQNRNIVEVIWAIFFGRMLFDVGEMDNWEVFGYIKGMAGTGKSTIFNVLQSIYMKQFVGKIENNAERVFGQSTWDRALIILGTELGNGVSLSVEFFKSWVTGEPVQLARKYKDPVVTKITAPGIGAGNESLGLNDQANSIARRLLMVHFARSVPSEVSVTDVGERLKLEMFNIIVKGAMAYRALREHVGRQSIWAPGVLPPYFHETRDAQQRNNSVIEDFMRSGQVVLARDVPEETKVYVPSKALKQAILRFANDNGKGRVSLGDDAFMAICDRYNITQTEHAVNRWYGGERMHTRFFLGIDLHDVRGSFAANRSPRSADADDMDDDDVTPPRPAKRPHHQQH